MTCPGLTENVPNSVLQLNIPPFLVVVSVLWKASLYTLPFGWWLSIQGDREGLEEGIPFLEWQMRR